MKPKNITDKIPPKLNAEWHRAHRMPERPTLEQRLTWHAEHAQHCRCREMPDQIRADLIKRGLL